ncbi:MAG: hypothetical protein KDC05_10585 [Bacteroidales bacterium]|nr:hypothetical protein [Bacteroidales bacterium]
MRKNGWFKYVLVLTALTILGGCATYYQKTLKYQQFIYSGELEKAKKFLDKNEVKTGKKDRILYLMNQGWVNWMIDKNTESNKYLEEADLMIEDYRKKFGLELATLVSNPSIKPYKPEDFEKVMVNYLKALNYLNMNEYDEALVEARRINLKLQEINDQYKDHKNRYDNDAFAHVMMGLIYDANREYNDAFIAYRNAYNIYKNDYAENFGVQTPEQLKKDILRTAYLNRFGEELEFYEKEFGMKYEPKQHTGGELIFIWHNGFGPVKAEWGINFVKTSSGGGVIVFHNEELGISFPFFIGDKPDEEKSAFAQLNFIRVAFPKYVERKPVYTAASVTADGNEYPLQVAEDINAIAFKTLYDRMLREMANSLLRLATKKAMEYAVRQENQDAGAALGILNALTEKADTRNWQTLPYEIRYVRIPLDTGNQTVRLKTFAGSRSEEQNFQFNIQKGKTYFYTFQSLETQPPQGGYGTFE